MNEDSHVNICFHGIGVLRSEREPGERSYWISVDRFLRLLDYAAARPEVSISFDDGNLSDRDIACDQLLSRGMRASFFPLAGRLTDPGSLSRVAINELLDAGMTIGSHGMRHRPWRKLSEAELDEEVRQAGEILTEVTGQAICRAAVPLGRYDRRVLAVLRRHQYVEVNTSDCRLARPGNWLQPRFSVRAEETPGSLEERIARASMVAGRARLAAIGMIKRFS